LQTVKRPIKGRLAKLLKELVSLKYLLQIGGLQLLLHRAAHSRAHKTNAKPPKDLLTQNDASTSTKHRF
jgi:hypothetical protein